MICRHPIALRGMVFGCGVCLPCRLNRRRVWTHRMMLEHMAHRMGWFITLTYDEDALPPGGSLCRRDLALFMKMLRRSVEPFRLRYYACGEYGDRMGRPHYHLALWGVETELEAMQQTVLNCWCRGLVHVGTLDKGGMEYVAGYVAKKAVGRGRSAKCGWNQRRLRGRVGEFGVMSNRPGLGVPAVEGIVEACMRGSHGEVWPDAPTVLNHGGKKYPLGRFMRGKLRVALSVDTEQARREAMDKCREEVQVMLEGHEPVKGAWSEWASGLIGEKMNQACLNVETRSKIYSKGRTL